MQINVDKKSIVFLSIIGILIVALGFALTRSNDVDMDHMSGHMNHSSANSKYSGADIMFLQMMIPHHQQAIDISQLALKKSHNSELKALAEKISSDQAKEILQMKAWLRDANASEDPGHSMHGMGGMLTETELSKLTAASGNEFDLLWLKGMIGHHDGAIHMSSMITDAQNSEIKSFGEKVVSDQSAQIDQMNHILKRIS